MINGSHTTIQNFTPFLTAMRILSYEANNKPEVVENAEIFKDVEKDLD